MPKLPKLSDLTDVSGMVNKMKSAFDSLTGPSSSEATEEALAKEKDPIKAKFLEVELLINQLNDIAIIQNKTINALKSKYADIKKLTEKIEAEDKSSTKEETSKSEEVENKKTEE